MYLAPRLLARSMWSFCLMEGQLTPSALMQERRIRLFDSRRVRRGSRHRHTQADPCLFVNGSELYVFYEVQECSEVGYIAACRTRDLVHFEDLGPVLRRNDHISYPHVLKVGDDVFMLPETKEAGEVALYRFTAFPSGLTRARRLIAGPYTDPTLFRTPERWWLFATGPHGLELFSAEDLASGDFVPHPMNPICTDARLSRCGGAIVELDGRLFRPAQAFHFGDGGNLRLLEIGELSPSRYAESDWAPELFTLNEPWQSRGAHHLSLACFAGRTIVAVDGRHPDFVINGTILNPLWRIISTLRGVRLPRRARASRSLVSRSRA
ncbi:hypothetical protein E2493_18740 [Sphingomonas parva]|uniref:Glucosamine inositolphosphorylceramide transferase 1 N-terminal domain-containing protein n=1 Tax=Sphingomonas parva TaxID=2555898 RepID=A0A4Y8ZMN2_9SPHN|nr:hypothetical protein [Sphingomonas parva]TFI56717.1 hypothetical protein E2493_18740 [Sphingomonas parva]